MDKLQKLIKLEEWYVIERKKIQVELWEEFDHLLSEKKAGKPVVWNGIMLNWFTMAYHEKETFIATFWHRALRSRYEVANIMGTTIYRLDKFKKHHNITSDRLIYLDYFQYLKKHGVEDDIFNDLKTVYERRSGNRIEK